MTELEPLVAWDVDDVLNDLMRVWLAHTELAIPYTELLANPPHRQLGMGHAEYLASLDAFRLARYESLAPSEDILRWFEREGRRARHIAVTSVPLAASHLSASWVLRHFGRWVQGFFVAPSSRPRDGQGPSAPSKAAILSRFRGRIVLVDDAEHNVRQAHENGFAAILFPRPWNSAPGDTGSLLQDLTDTLGRWEQS